MSRGMRLVYSLPQREIVTVTTSVPGPRQPLYAGCASAAMPSERAGTTGTPSFTSASSCTKSWEAARFALRRSSRISSAIICRGVAVTAAARWAAERNRSAGAWGICW